MTYRVVKQLYPTPQPGDPEWASRNVYVARLSGSGDQIWEFDIESEADTKSAELSGSDSTDRNYKVIEI